MGGIAGAGSGDLFIAFSTAPTGTPDAGRRAPPCPMLSDDVIDPVYEAAVQATEEAIINAMLAARTMTGADWSRVPALPHDGCGRCSGRTVGWAASHLTSGARKSTAGASHAPGSQLPAASG